MTVVRDGVVVASLQGIAHRERCALHAGELAQLAHESLHLGSITRDGGQRQQVLQVVAHGCMHEMVRLHPDAQSCRYHHYCCHILHDDEHTRECHARSEAEGASHHVNGTHTRDDCSRHGTRHTARQQHDDQYAGEEQRVEQSAHVYLGMQQCAGIRAGCPCQCYTQQQRHQAQEHPLQGEPQHDVAALCAHQTAGGHLAGTFSALCRTEVDIVEHREEQDYQAHSKQDGHQSAVAAQALLRVAARR